MTMNVAIDRPDAYWLPSRHRFALARLIAFARLGNAPGAINQHEHLILSIDHDQTAAEMQLVAAWVFVTTMCYIAAALPINLPLAIVLAIPLAAIAIHLPIVIGGPILRLLIGDGNHIKIVSVTTMSLLLIASSYVATTTSWARLVAWLFLTIFILNGAAAAILWLMRNTVRAAEERCVR
jgi:hypothetical protein